jgi:exopolysaccharide biosynthesis polyprenyl glycosylphosphotransferase
MAIVADTSMATPLGAAAVLDGSDRGTGGSPGLRRALVGGDGVALFTQWLAAYALVGGSERPLLLATTTALIGVWVLQLQGLYLSRVASMRSVELAGIVRASAILGAAALAVERFSDGSTTAAPLVGSALTFAGLAVWRGAFRGWLRAQRQRGRFSRRVILVGIDEQTRDLRDLLEHHPELGFALAGVVGDRLAAEQNGLADVWIGPLNDVRPLVKGKGASGVIVSATALDGDTLNATVRGLLDSGCHVHVSPGVRGIDHRRMHSVHVGYEPLFYVERSGLTRWQLSVKRGIDVALSAVTLLVVLPVLLVAALAIWLYDRGPVLFRQTRVGRGGEAFSVYKLRTMRRDAEDELDGLLEMNERDGPLFKMTDDPRVTRVGRIIRELNIDELPQLWNVLRGDMSLVGPRPALPAEYELFDPRLRTRTNVLPGITGLWQVEARENPSFEAYARLDMYYVENWSPTLDLTILISTVESEIGRIIRRVLDHRADRDAEHASVVVDLAERAGPAAQPQPATVSSVEAAPPAS